MASRLCGSDSFDTMDLDDSDFYGDEDTTKTLQRRVEEFDPIEGARLQHAGTARPPRHINFADEASRLHNPYAGVPYAWQLTEKVDDFLDRLPPLTTEQSEHIPWLYICNPYIPRAEKRRSDSGLTKGNEDEAPVEEGSKLELVVEGGTERLQILQTGLQTLQETGKPKAFIQREMNKERKIAALDVLNLAHAGKVRTGKVNETWATLAHATANNELGIAAKIAPRPPFEEQRRDRLICVYTADFNDKTDVGRVLQRLRELRLVETRGRVLYYKPDIYTYVGIANGNPWGLGASIYSSRDAF
ncbi:splicing factor 3b [Purpureocillium lavendulum]|uniref:Splicing factor 3b n=1 Tax=Purpureocillium lavendulum TaxID=1247861 RepID=A0AB34FP02_9HYPO|nr:splicing factor 3b [Purpureocillium lavendulum]